MTFDEIDFETATWRVPKERMKMQKEHHVPLSAAALAILWPSMRHAAKSARVSGAANETVVADVAEHAFAPDEGPGDRSRISRHISHVGR
jgi:integrase